VSDPVRRSDRLILSLVIILCCFALVASAIGIVTLLGIR
jgi:hypothetical protein